MLDGCPFSRQTRTDGTMEEWQYKAAFVIQFRTETDAVAQRFEGRVEHIASTKATRFYSLDELLAFITRVLREIRDTDEL